jgi:hypothetical protein
MTTYKLKWDRNKYNVSDIKYKAISINGNSHAKSKI